MALVSDWMAGKDEREREKEREREREREKERDNHDILAITGQ